MFAINEGSFAGASDDALIKTADEFSDYITYIVRELAVQAFVHPSIYEVTTGNGHTLAEALFSESSIIPKHLRVRLYTAIDRGTFWTSEEKERYISQALHINGKAFNYPTLSRQYSLSADRQPGTSVGVAAGVLPDGWVDAVGRDGVARPIHISSRKQSLLDFHRRRLKIIEADENEFIQSWPHAFPLLEFNSSIASQLNGFSRKFGTIRATIIDSLGALNDGFDKIYTEEKGNAFAVNAKFSALYGFDVSPDSPKTHRNKAAMAERDVVHKGKKYRCEWHLKLTPTVDRIHFYPKFDTTGKILIGIMCTHLTT
jgi:hypothetical protein